MQDQGMRSLLESWWQFQAPLIFQSSCTCMHLSLPRSKVWSIQGWSAAYGMRWKKYYRNITEFSNFRIRIDHDQGLSYEMSYENRWLEPTFSPDMLDSPRKHMKLDRLENSDSSGSRPVAWTTLCSGWGGDFYCRWSMSQFPPDLSHFSDDLAYPPAYTVLRPNCE